MTIDLDILPCFSLHDFVLETLLRWEQLLLANIDSLHSFLRLHKDIPLRPLRLMLIPPL